jgi:hypothetical protein
MNLNDLAMIAIAMANLVLRYLEMRKARHRKDDEPDQSAD